MTSKIKLNNNHLIILAFIFGADVVILDAFLALGLKKLIFLLLLLITLINTQKIRITIADIVIYPIFTIAVLTRPGLSDFSVVVADYYNLITSHIVFLILMSYIKSEPIERNSSVKFSLTFFLVFSTSWVYFVINPTILFQFSDLSGHLMKIIPGSLTSSIYHIGSLQFARLSIIFDEPGTAATFLMCCTSTLLLIRSKSWIIIFFSGFFTISLAYIMWMITVISCVIPNIVKSRKLLLMATIAAIFLVYFLVTNEVFLNYISNRFKSIFNSSHNRAGGNAEAISVISSNYRGLSDAAWNNRLLSSSGILAMAAYKGILFCIIYCTFYARLLLLLSKKSFSRIGLLTFIITLLMTIGTKNTPFFASVLLMTLISFVFFTLPKPKSDIKKVISQS